MFEFKILKRDKKTLARTGSFSTNHGILLTPNLAFVATHGQIKLLDKDEFNNSGAELMIVNTYHLWIDKKIDEIRKSNGIHNYSGFKGIIMSDSGGYQVFSLGFRQIHKVGKLGKMFPGETHKNIDEKNIIKIGPKGVSFDLNGKDKFLGPKLSIKVQEKIGADIIFAFDECTSPLNSKNYTNKSLQRTHNWAKICKNIHRNDNQTLFGIIQGGAYKDLRMSSSKFIKKLNFAGYGIGGSLGKTKNDMKNILNWIIPELDENKPRHLLGIGQVSDIFNSIEQGIDIFDCVIPTREARHGVIYTNKGKFQIKKIKTETRIIENNCGCLSCKNKIKTNTIYKMFKSEDLEEKLLAGKYLTLHNIYFFSSLMKKVREAIKENKFQKLKKEYFEFYK